MAFNQIIEFSTTAGTNTDIRSVSVDEGIPPSNLNNALRNLAKMLADAEPRIVNKAAGSHTALKTDHNQVWRATGAVTLGLTAAATLTTGWKLFVKADGGDVTIDPAGAETIDGAATKVLLDGTSTLIVCDGSNFFSVLNGFEAGNFSLYSNDTGALGPVLESYHDSATPAADDVVFKLLMSGENAAGGKENYAAITGEIRSLGAGVEEGRLRFHIMDSGTLVPKMHLTEGGLTFENPPSDNMTINIGDNGDDMVMIIQADSGPSSGGQLFVYGSNHATNPGDIAIAVSGSFKYSWDNSDNCHEFYNNVYIGADFRLTNQVSSRPGNGSNTQGAHFINSTSVLAVNSNGDTSNFGRAQDGTFMVWCSTGTAQGALSIAGATTTYSTFMGSHWSQLADGSKPDLLRGTIVESIAQLCQWQGETDEKLPCFKVSDEAGSKAVYGVFAWWDDYEERVQVPVTYEETGETVHFEDRIPSNDAFIAALGAYMIRVRQQDEPEIGDLIESNGDGTGRIQTDDVFSSRTVAKITSTAWIETYPDGSRLYPATLHCG